MKFLEDNSQCSRYQLENLLFITQKGKNVWYFFINIICTFTLVSTYIRLKPSN
jgi:hypothetical protein